MVSDEFIYNIRKQVDWAYFPNFCTNILVNWGYFDILIAFYWLPIIINFSVILGSQCSPMLFLFLIMYLFN